MVASTRFEAQGLGGFSGNCHLLAKKLCDSRARLSPVSFPRPSFVIPALIKRPCLVDVDPGPVHDGPVDFRFVGPAHNHLHHNHEFRVIRRRLSYSMRNGLELWQFFLYLMKRNRGIVT